MADAINFLAFAIVLTWATRIVVFWFKATGLNEWFRQGLIEERMAPTLLVSVPAGLGLAAAFIGFLFCIQKVVTGSWTHG